MVVAGLLHNIVGAGIKRALADVWTDIPGGSIEREHWMTFPKEAKFDFYGKNLNRWVVYRWPELEQAIRDGMHTYRWVFENKPDAVVVQNDEYARPRGAAMAARDLNIPVIEVVHGNVHVIQIGHWSTKKYATHCLGTWEYYDWHSFYDLQWPQHNRMSDCIATGSVTHLPFAGVDRQELRSTSRFELNIRADAPAVTILTDAVFRRNPWQDPGYSYGAFVEMVKAWKMAREIIPGLQLIVKVHPYEKDEKGEKLTAGQYHNLLKEWGVEEDYTVIDDPLFMALAPTDLVMGLPSSAMAGAMELGIPCIVLGFTPFFEERKFEGKGFMVARKPLDVLSLLTKVLLEDDTMRQLIKETTHGKAYFSAAQGATHRITQAIRAIAEGKEVPEACWADLPTAEPGMRV